MHFCLLREQTTTPKGGVFVWRKSKVNAVRAFTGVLICAMILFAMFSGRGIYLDIALVAALFGIIDTMLVGRYLERRL